MNVRPLVECIVVGEYDPKGRKEVKYSSPPNYIPIKEFAFFYVISVFLLFHFLVLHT